MLIRELHRQAFTPASADVPPMVGAGCAGPGGAKGEAQLRAVRLWLKGQYFPSDRDRFVRQELADLIEDNGAGLAGANDLAIVSGDNGMGKSTLMERLALQWHREAVGDDADPLVLPTWRPPGFAGSGHYAPVVLLSLHGVTTARSFRAALIEALDHAPSAKASPARLFRDHGTRILIVDDVHFLVSTPKKGVDVLQEIKYIVTALGELGGTVILVGAHLESHPLMDDPQVIGRSQPPFQFGPYRVDTDEERRAWIAMLREAERVVAPCLPAAHDGMLYRDAAGLIHQRTQGRMRDVVRMIRQATVAAVADGSFAVSAAHLKGVVLSERSDRELLSAFRARPVKRSARGTRGGVSSA